MDVNVTWVTPTPILYLLYKAFEQPHGGLPYGQALRGVLIVLPSRQFLTYRTIITMTEQEATYEYELIDISFEQGYELPEDDVAWRVSEDVSPPNDERTAIEYDADGIPKGRTKEESLIRRKIIFDFIQKWRAEHIDNTRIYNTDLKEYIKINQVFMLESVAHAAYSYLSTKAVLKMEHVMEKARKIGLTKTKEGNSNQKPFEQMIIMRYKSEELGNIKMTVGIRKKTKEKVQYNITVPNPDAPFIDESIRIKDKSKDTKRKKRPK